MTRSLRVIKPFTVNDSMLVSTDVPETDYAAWSSGTTYAIGDRVILTSTHKIYEAIQGSNINHNPAVDATWWVEVSPTNRWKAFDLSNSTKTAKSTSMSYRITVGRAINAFAALNLTGATSIRVRLVSPTFGTVYDKTDDLTAIPVVPLWWGWYFSTRSLQTVALMTDLPSYPDADILIDLQGGTDLAVGVFLFGQMRSFGIGVQTGARLGIVDYSRKETNEFGDAVLVQRAFSKRASYEMLVDSSEVDSVAGFLSDVRAVPCLWIASDVYDSTIIYGIYKTFDIIISYPTYADCVLEIEGLT